MSTCVAISGLLGIICRLNAVISAAVPFLIGLGVVIFIWGVIQYVIGSAEEAKKKGRDKMLLGIVGLAVIIALWGLVYVLADTFGVRGQLAPDVSGLITSAPETSGCTIAPKFQGLVTYVICLIKNSVIPLLFAIAVVMFIWGAIRFFLVDAADAEAKAKGKQFMLWGIIALAVMISIWGLVKILGDTFSIPTNVLPSVKPD